jgi:hypothetical protein
LEAGKPSIAYSIAVSRSDVYAAGSCFVSKGSSGTGAYPGYTVA